MALEQNDDRSPDQGAGLPSSADRPDSPDQVTNTALEALRVAAAAARQRYEEIAQGVGVQPPDRDHRVAAAPEAGPAAVQGLDDRNEQRLDKALAAQSEALRQAAAARPASDRTPNPSRGSTACKRPCAGWPLAGRVAARRLARRPRASAAPASTAGKKT